MTLDHDLRKMATVLQDADLLARIGGGDIIAIEAKYHHGCLTKYKNKYRSKQRASRQDSVSSEGNLVNAQVFVECCLSLRIALNLVNVFFKLSELHHLYQNHLKVLGIEGQN